MRERLVRATQQRAVAERVRQLVVTESLPPHDPPSEKLGSARHALSAEGRVSAVARSTSSGDRDGLQAGGAQRAGASAWARFSPGRRAATTVGVVAVLVAIISVWWVASDHPQSLAVTTPLTSRPSGSAAGPSSAPVIGSAAAAPASGSGPGPVSGPASGSGTAAVCVVDVVGKVQHPGVVEVPVGARVQDAVQAAGGAQPGVDLSGLNLARRVVDGEQIAVGVPAAMAVPPDATSGSATGSGSTVGSNTAPVNLNTATAEQFDALPGVGPVLAKNILGWRSAHGRFSSIDQLREVSGIGPAKFATLKGSVTV